MLDTLPVELLLLAEHNIERDSALWSREGRRRGIPTAVVSISSPDVTEAARVYAADEGHWAVHGVNRLLPLAAPELDQARSRRPASNSRSAIFAFKPASEPSSAA